MYDKIAWAAPVDSSGELQQSQGSRVNSNCSRLFPLCSALNFLQLAWEKCLKRFSNISDKSREESFSGEETVNFHRPESAEIRPETGGEIRKCSDY